MCLATTSQENHQFAHWLLKVGSGEIQIDEEGCIPLPQQIIHGLDLQTFIQVLYIGIENKNGHTDEYFKNQIILSTLNDVVDNINNVIIQRFPRVFQTF
jgi:hypothetical protein